MTLLIGPPGSGKSAFLKVLAGRLHPKSAQTLSGEVYYQGDNIRSEKFLVNKVADYIEQGDTHDPTLTVEETLDFAWHCTTGGLLSYGRAKDFLSAVELDQRPPSFFVHNMLAVLGLKGCKDTYVGNNMIRGVSGGQKRRVTIGEMMANPRPIKFMDSISSGLDSATTFDIIRALRLLTHSIGFTSVVSLLQPSPDVYHLFDDIILLCEGHIIYQGPRDSIIPYFQSIGYFCPKDMDEADFLQELPTIQGKRFASSSSPQNDASNTPVLPIRHTPKALARAWKNSSYYHALLSSMKYQSLEQAKQLEKENDKEWFPDEKEKYAKDSFLSIFLYYLPLNLSRQMKIFLREKSFTLITLIKVLIVGAITGSLFSNISKTDMTTLNGLLFFSVLYSALGSFFLIPLIFEQKLVFYKMKDALFFPTVSFTIAQSLTLVPLQLVENIIYITMVYWSAGLSSEHNGSRFLTFIVIAFSFTLLIAQLFRLMSAILPTSGTVMPLSGVIIVIMVLFSGFIQPKALISDGWIWFYYLNPVAWALKAVTVNELKSSKYDFLTCTDPLCLGTKRFGDFILEQYGNPTDERYIWYSLAVIIAEFLLLFAITTICLHYIRTVSIPAPPLRTDEEEQDSAVIPNRPDDRAPKMILDAMESGLPQQTIQPSPSSTSPATLSFEPVSMAFKEISYTVTLSNGEDIDLLKEVDGFFEPGTLTCLMGSSGAGKTTLLDVLAGRKNTGVIRGEMYLNGVPKDDDYFRRINGYVEQFDTLPHKSTTREAITFSAALRLSRDVSVEQRSKWVDAILDMLDLHSIENKLIGTRESAAMSFEQRKRVSIGVELAANPSILFLDEPTTGLDSLASQSLIHNLRTIAANGRTIVCTIHQPSTAIFSSFDNLLLLKRGGQVVFFGSLGESASHLTSFFQEIPGVSTIPKNTNPASWMLEVINSNIVLPAAPIPTADSDPVDVTMGDKNVAKESPNSDVSKQGESSPHVIDFAVHYRYSVLRQVNLLRLETLASPNDGSKRLDETAKKSGQTRHTFNASYLTQFQLLYQRMSLTYWRTPIYSLGRPFTNLLIALIFGSAYPQQKYSTYVAATSRAAVIFITSLFCAILPMILVIPFMSKERPTFYREQQSKMYSVGVYCSTLFLVEIPYLLLASLAFTLPFFFIVGFQFIGEVTEKFFWFWLFQCLLQGVMVFLGEFYVSLGPNEVVTQALGGFNHAVTGLFCGFLITQDSFPTFWLFMYWLNPLHYALEGLIMTQFHGDDTSIRLMNGQLETAEKFIGEVQFSTWSYGHVGYDVLALGLFLAMALAGNYLCLTFLRHEKR